MEWLTYALSLERQKTASGTIAIAPDTLFFEPCIRFDLAYDGVSKRAEIYDPTQAELWGSRYIYEFDMYLEQGFIADANWWTLLSQWHGIPDAGEIPRHPPLMLYAQDGQLSIRGRWDSAKISTAQAAGTQLDLWSGKLKTGVWEKWKFDVAWNYANPTDLYQGFCRVYRDGEQIVNYIGRIGYNDPKGPYWKVGLYHWDQSTPFSHKTSYVKNMSALALGNKPANWPDV